MDATCLTWGDINLPQIRSILINSIAARTRVYWDQPALIEKTLQLYGRVLTTSLVIHLLLEIFVQRFGKPHHLPNR
eukprot:12302202-Karenia_brevis.AAC.1